MESINSNLGERPDCDRGASDSARARLSGWGRRLLAGKPCYLVSAALLLFGINRLAVDPEFLKVEAAKLGFNFSALFFLILGLWVTGSAAHLYCVGYVSDLAFHPWMLTPLTLVLAWTAWRRLPDLRPAPVASRWPLRQALLVLAALTPLLAATAPTSRLFFALTILNAVLFGWVSFADPSNKLAGQLALASGAALLAGLPIEWGLRLAPGFTRVRAIELCLGGYVVLQALRSRHPAWGLCGAIAAALAPGALMTDFNGSLALHVGLSFLVPHSLRWDERISKGVVGLRIGTAVSWMTHAFVWTRVDGGAAVSVISSAAVLILFIYTLLGVVTGQWGARVVPAGAVLSFLAAPANSFFGTSPAGLLAVLGSFAFFGLGTLAALTKHRWHPVTAAGRDGAQP